MQEEGPRRIRMTRQAALVDDVLAAATEFRTAQDVYAQLRSSGARIGQTTVYRHLQLLADDGEVDALQLDGGEVAYRRCATGHHHHHLVCRSCGRSVEVECPDVDAWAQSVANDAGFADPSHRVEVFGLCTSCQ